jgi:hypothetical protein
LINNSQIKKEIENGSKFRVQESVKKIFSIYKKGFWKFWLVYLASLLIIKAVMLGFYWFTNYIQNNSFAGFTLAQSEYFMRVQDLFFNLTLDSTVDENNFLTKSFLLYFVLQVLYQAFLSIPFVISILVAKNVFDRGNEKLKKQISDVFLIIVPVLIIGVITSIMVQLGSYLWYIPGLIIMTFTSLVFPILIDEKLKPIPSIKRSFTLVKEQFLNIVGIIILIVIGQAIVLGISKFFAWLIVHDPAVANQILDVYNSISVIYSYEIVQSIIYSIVAPFTAISSYVIYREALSVRNFKLGSMVESTAKFAERNNTLSVNKQLNNVVKTETKSLIKSKYCSNCGSVLDTGAPFCESCGQKT